MMKVFKKYFFYSVLTNEIDDVKKSVDKFYYFLKL